MKEIDKLTVYEELNRLGIATLIHVLIRRGLTSEEELEEVMEELIPYADLSQEARDFLYERAIQDAAVGEAE